MPPSLLHYSDVENAADDPAHVGRLVATIFDVRDEHTVVCGTGDNTGPGVLSLVTKGRHSLAFFDAVEPDLETFGNHDFDHGLDAIGEIVRESPQTWVTTNVVDGDGERFLADETVPWTLREVDGTTVGFVGVTDPRTTAYVPEAKSLEFLDPVPVVREASATLRERGADRVVVLSHVGRGDELVATETDVDVILGGHVHSEIVERIDGTLLTRPGVNGSVVFEITLGETPDVTRHVVDEDGERFLADDTVTDGAATDEGATGEGFVHDGVANAMARERARADLDEVVAHVAEPIERTESTVFRGESRIGNFVADAYRWAAGTDVGLQNSGGIREGPPLSGAVTVADLVSVVPFDAPVAVAEVTGEELRSVVRQCCGANVVFGNPEWWNGHVSGLRVVWNWADNAIESLVVNGTAVSDGDTYTIATADFLFHTSEEFPTLNESHRTETLPVQYEVLAEYARENGIEPRIDGRIVYRERNA